MKIPFSLLLPEEAKRVFCRLVANFLLFSPLHLSVAFAIATRPQVSRKMHAENVSLPSPFNVRRFTPFLHRISTLLPARLERSLYLKNGNASDACLCTLRLARIWKRVQNLQGDLQKILHNENWPRIHCQCTRGPIRQNLPTNLSRIRRATTIEAFESHEGAFSQG